MAIKGSPRTFHKKFKFIVEIDSFDETGFQSCSELSAELAVSEQWEGGAITATKEPGRMTVPAVTLAKGATKSLELWNWFRQVADMAADTGLIDDEYKRTVDIVQQDRDGKTLRRWRLYEAWPSKFVAGDWDNGSDDNVITQIDLQMKRFEPIDVQ